LILSNQLKILERLYPEEADAYANQRKAVEEGYSFHYPSLMDHIYNEMTVEECREVLDILQMFSTIKISFEDLDDKSDIKENRIRFAGFDGNNETRQMIYARYFIVDLERYDELRSGSQYSDYNSHSPSIDRYRRMLKVWEEYPNQYALNNVILEKTI